MAADWIKMSSDLGTHPKVVRMASALNADRLRLVGGLHAVWCLFDKHSVDGELVGYTAAALDDLIGWPGFAAALRAVDWLEENGTEGLYLPRFDTHNGASAKRRAMESDRKRRDRKTSAPDADKKRTREEKKRVKNPPPPTGGDEGFAEFWKAYPAIGDRKAAKDQCLAKWRKRSCAAIKDRIIAALLVQKALPKWQEEGGRFVPAPLVWLNQERWVATEEANAAAPQWWETVKGAQAKGETVGIGRWDECIPFAAYIGQIREKLGPARLAA